jgi:hypothetical protein
MSEQVRVELVSRDVPIDDDTLAHRADGVRRLAELGHLDPEQGEVATTRQAWFARIGGVEAEVVDYAISRPEQGAQAAVSLVLLVDSVSVGDPSTGVEQPQVRDTAPAKNERPMWGAGKSDPREKIPGWAPSNTSASGESVALDVEAGASA